MKCLKCGAEAPSGAAFCPKCGAALVRAPAKPASAAGGFIRPGGADPEETLWQGTYSKRAMIGAWVAAGAATLFFLVVGLAGGLSGDQWLIALAILAAIWVGLLARLFYVQLSTHYWLTNQRFIHERGLLWRTIDRIETIDVDDVICQQGPVERMLGVGTIRMKSSDQSTPEFVLKGIADVRGVAALIDEARRKERRKRGMYVENV